VETILAGSEIAWQTFVERYAGLISHVARRYLFEEEEAANVLVRVLESMHKGKLETYRGRSSLATWLILVSRNAAADALRHRFGRRDIPQGLMDLDTLHKEVFRIYYVEGNTFAATLKELSLQGQNLNVDQLLEALQLIDDRITDRTLKRIAYDLASQSIGGASGRLLEYCDNVKWEAEENATALDPLDQLVAREAELRALEALKLVAQLAPKDQMILSLRFDKGMRAKEIAEKLGFSGQRKVFTVLDRIIRQLRRLNTEKNDRTPNQLKNIK